MKVKNTFSKAFSYLKDYRFSSIWIKYFVLLLVCLVLPVLSMSVWYGRQMRNNVYDELMLQNETALKQSQSNINFVLRSTEALIYNLSLDESVQYVSFQSSPENDSTDNLQNVLNILNLVRKSNRYLDSIYLYYNRSDTVATDNGLVKYADFSDKEIIEDYVGKEMKQIEIIPRIKEGYYPYLLSVCYPLLSGNKREMGMIVVNIDVEKLGAYIGTGNYRPSGEIEGLLIFDKNMDVLAYSDEYRLFHESEIRNELMEELAEWDGCTSEITKLWGSDYIVTGLKSEKDGLHYVFLRTTREFEENNQVIGKTLVGLMVIIVGVCLVVALVLAKWIYSPIQKTVRILSDMSMMTEWDKKEHVDEIEAIQRSILLAKKEKDDLNEQVKERMITLHNAQLCALQAQINPHFLFNTLDSLGNAAILLMQPERGSSSSVAVNNPMADMIFTLGKLMRISLSSENYLVPLSEEMEHIKLYMKLLEFRYHHKIDMQIQIPKEMLKYRIVKLTLQPLIENAVQHGELRLRSDAVIWIKGDIIGEELYLYVTDNGVGISPEMRKQLLEQMKTSTINNSRHIGMRNVDQRLKLVFGEEYGLDITIQENGGTGIVIHYKTV